MSRRIKELSAVKAIELDEDDYLCDFPGMLLYKQGWSLKLQLDGQPKPKWISRMYLLVEERDDGSVIFFIPASVAIKEGLKHEFIDI